MGLPRVRFTVWWMLAPVAAANLARHEISPPEVPQRKCLAEFSGTGVTGVAIYATQ